MIEEEVVKKPRKKRKTSPRGKGICKRPNSSAHFKKLWQDPEWRAARLKDLAKGRAKIVAEKKWRVGVPDGMRAPEAAEAWAKARELGRKFIKIMEDNNEVEKVVVPGSEAEMAKRALEEAFVMAVSPLGDAKTKNTAIRTVLEWTKSKPESKSKLTLNKAEDWLDELAKDANASDAGAE